MDTKQLPSPSSPAPAEQLPAYSAAPAMTDIIPDIIPLRAVAAPPSREHLRRAMAFALAMPFGTLFLLVGMGCVAVSFSEVDGCDGDDWCEADGFFFVGFLLVGVGAALLALFTYITCRPIRVVPNEAGPAMEDGAADAKGYLDAPVDGPADVTKQ